tara:strand:- start:158 stop:616 length:459 start_codon:yes stop_codon:yes gene_type:complete
MKINEGPKIDSTLHKGLKKIHTDMYKLLANYRTVPGIEKFVNAWMEGLHRSLDQLGVMKEDVNMIKLKDLITERKLESWDTNQFEDTLKRLNKMTADLNKLWPQFKKGSKAKTKWEKANSIAYSLQSMGKHMYVMLDRLRATLDAPEYDDDE